MSMRTVELVSEWDTVPFDGGYDGLQSLSDQGFSGAVTTGPTQLFMLNGTVVGVLEGDIEAFDGADGTARAAPHDALPLLVVMQDRADSPRAQYYTEDTPISDVDRTLEDGNFTGFVELSENVLSGDYYMVYHQGRSMSVAWVGNSQRLITDEEAFEQADGEVGIYKVMPADIEPVEIPEPTTPTDDTEEAVAGSATAVDERADAPEETATAASGETTTDSAPAEEAADPASDAGSDSSADDSAATASDRSDPSDDAGSGTASAPDVSERGGGAAGPPGSKAAGASQGAAVDRTQRDETDTTGADSGTTAEAPATDAESGPTEPANPAPTETEPTPKDGGTAEARTETEPTPKDGGTAEARTEPPEPSGGRTTQAETADPPTDRTGTASTDEGVGDSQTAAGAVDSDAVSDLETRSIPSLDPERSSSTPEQTTPTQSTTATQSTSSESPSAESASADSSSTAGAADPESTESQSGTSAATQKSQSQDSQSTPSPELQATLEEREAEIAELEGEIRDLSAENEELAAERDRLLDELEEARAEIRRLEEELAAAGGTAPSEQTLSAAEAIDGTNLFVRYHSKGEATLETAQSGSADRASVEENLRLEYHTQFDADEAVVDGEAFEEFLHGSIQYRFVDWLVRNLLYEIQSTGHESAMGVLYDAIPKVDRAELNGKVSVTYTEDGQEHRSQETFDVVVRDRMGNPLVVANINDARQPATDGQMTDIVRNAERVGSASDSLAAAFLVTSSFFEPEALETAREATSSGLFSRDKRKSFVNLSRKGGYHLCLLEARNKEFHLAVPEL
ncbi:hypothetical protein EGH22_00670 [Halomicroarcula sp. F28]|uniref:DUF7527 domain-containing protein n=1 Tax=Haloarcula salinisoli TaxID=2487746 RepID=UPI001C72FB42|nr:hypothetical protein [Halomicroarcula salinisoli]MBX0284827.1 hypothetical protein [Halomicroarcula salinisoli]